MAQRQAQQQSSVAIYVVAASVIAAGYLAWLRYPSTPAVLAGFLIAAWIEPPAILTGKKDASGFPTPAHAGEEKTLGRSQFWQGMKWRLVLPSADWLPGWPVFGAWYAGVAAGAFCLGLPLEDRRWAPANAAAIFVTVATVAAVRRRTSAEGDSPGTRLDSFAPALLENPVVAAGVAVGSLVATAAAVWAARMYLPESHQVPLGAMVPAFALVMVMAFAAWPWSNAALSHWRVVVAGRSEWRPRWQSLKHDPAPFLIDREEVGSARVDTFEAPPGVGAVGYRLLGPKITPTIGAGSAVAVLECPNEDANGPMPGTLHPLRFQVVVWPSGDLPDLTDPDLNDDVAVLRARCGIPWAVDKPGYLRAVLVDAEKITSEDSPTAAWRSRWEFPEGPNLTVYRTDLLGNISDGFGCQVLIDHRGGVLYFGDLTSGNADFVEGDAQARTLVRLETEDEWNGVWGQVLKQGTNPPTLQHDATADQELADGTVVHRVPWMTRLGIDPGDYRGLEPKLATGLNAAPFVAITGWPRKGDRLGERHPQAFVVYHSRSEVPSSPENLAPSPASAWVLAGHVNMAFDAARLARPELVRATALTVAESRHHIWNIRLRLYGGVTLADVRGQAHRLRQAFGVEWLRVDGADDGCSLYLGRQPKSRTVRLARPERDLLRLTALDWSQAWIDSGVTGVGGLVPTLTGSGRLPKNDAVEVLDFALPAGVDPVKVKGATAKLATATGNEFVEVRAGVEPSSVRLLVCEVNPLPDRIDFDFEEVDRSDGIPFATGVEGEPVTFVFTDSPHALVAGLTGSGKSVMAQGIIYGALVRGWQLYIIDPVKGGADFAFAKDRCVAFAGTPFEAAGVIDAVYQEVVRRKNLNSKHGVGSYLELPDDIRPPHIAVLIDEFTSLLGQSPLPPKSDDVEMSSERDAIEAENYARTRVGVMAGKLAREARSAGVTLLLATQKLNAKMLDAIPGASDLKTNLARTLLGKASFGDRASALRAPDDAPKFDGALPIGRGLWEPVTAPASAMQVWFAPQETLRAELVARVPELPVSRRLDVAQFGPPELDGDAPAPPLGEAERVIDRGIFSFDLDDLDMFSDEEDDEAVDVSDDDEPAEVLVDQAAGNDGVPSAGPVMFLAGAGATTLPAGVEGWGLWERVGEVVASAEMIEALDDLGVTIIWVPAAGEELSTVTDTFGIDPWPSLTVEGAGDVADRAAAVTAWVAAHPEVERVIYLDADLAMEDPDTLDSFAEGVLAGLIDTPFDPNKMFVAAPTRDEGVTSDLLETVAGWLLDIAPTPPPPAPTLEAGGPPQEPDQDPRPVLHVDDDELFPDLPRVSVPDGADPFA